MNETTNTIHMMSLLKINIFKLAVAGAVMGAVAELPAQDATGRWYLGLDAGVALQQDITVEESGNGKLSFDPGFRLDVSGGMHFSPSWKAEVEVGFIFNPVSSIGGERAGDMDYCQVPIMANGIYSIPLHGPISAYAGAGIGGVWGVLWHDVLGSEDGFTFGYQGFVGAKYALNDNLDLGLSYKLLGTIEHDLGGARVEGSFSHAILAGITFKF